VARELVVEELLVRELVIEGLGVGPPVRLWL